ncbi:hypothetical protein LWI28_007786 [Acer negundo]|uniref:Uncharacterized protein n=1 Tax=Acer negundo TaxID=4023 RepID=A0AAD5P1B5_ACENE|nr:hypothetical protein LWI28_007786 [Acer negundo]
MTNKESLLPSDASNHLIHRSTDEQSLVDSNGFSDIPKKLLDFAKKSQVFDWMVGVRRKIHENSELGYEEFDTRGHSEQKEQAKSWALEQQLLPTVFTEAPLLITTFVLPILTT